MKCLHIIFMMMNEKIYIPKSMTNKRRIEVVQKKQRKRIHRHKYVSFMGVDKELDDTDLTILAPCGRFPLDHAMSYGWTPERLTHKSSRDSAQKIVSNMILRLFMKSV
eukprot:227707_1